MRQCQLLRSDRNTPNRFETMRVPLDGDDHGNLEATCLRELGGQRHTQSVHCMNFLTKELQSIDAWHHQDWAPTSMPEWIPSISRPSAQDSKTPSRYLSLGDADMLNILGDQKRWDVF